MECLGCCILILAIVLVITAVIVIVGLAASLIAWLAVNGIYLILIVFAIVSIASLVFALLTAK